MEGDPLGPPRWEGHPPARTTPVAPNQALWIRPCVPRIAAGLTHMDAGYQSRY